MGICSESGRRKTPLDKLTYKSSISNNSTNKEETSNNNNKFSSGLSQTINNKSAINHKALMSK